jgi:hypothetical protein
MNLKKYDGVWMVLQGTHPPLLSEKVFGLLGVDLVFGKFRQIL